MNWIIIYLPIITYSYTHLSIVNLMNNGLLESDLPNVSKTITELQQHEIYAKQFESQKFHNFHGDSEMNTRFTLDKNRTQQSLWFIGKERGQIKLQVHVQTNQQINAFKYGVKIFLIDHTLKEVSLARYVTRVFLYSQNQVLSNLYQFRVVKDLYSNDSLNIDIKMSCQAITVANKQQDSKQLYEMVQKVANSIDDIFLDSLQSWQSISKAMNQQVESQHSATDIALFEMVFIMIVNICGFLLLRRELNKKILV